LRAVFGSGRRGSWQILEECDGFEQSLELAKRPAGDGEMAEVVSTRRPPEPFRDVRGDRNRRTTELGRETVSFDIGKLRGYSIRFHE
jgi:hypothetical protein